MADTTNIVHTALANAIDAFGLIASFNTSTSFLADTLPIGSDSDVLARATALGACIEKVQHLANQAREVAQEALSAAKGDSGATPTPIGEPGHGVVCGSVVLTLPEPITRLGREATWEIAALAQSIVEHSPLVSADQTPLVVRGMALRVAQLNSRLMAMLSDDLDGETPAEQERRMALIVVGEAAAPAAEEAAA